MSSNTKRSVQELYQERQQSDVLRDEKNRKTPATQPDLLANDPQFSAAVLVLRLKLAGAQI